MEMLTTKILRYKKDGNTVETITKTINKLYNNIVYFDKIYNEDYCGDYTAYNYFALSDDGSVAFPVQLQTQTTPENVKKYLIENNCDYTQKTLLQNFNALMANGKYINSLYLLFAELCQDFELANKMRVYKDAYRKKQEAEERTEQMRQQQEAAEKAEAERIKQEKELATAYSLIKGGKHITAKQFEILCNAESVKLPIKFLGWLREFCGDIRITKHTDEPLPESVCYVNSYNTTYYYVKGHKSTSLAKYADMLGQRVLI